MEKLMLILVFVFSYQFIDAQNTFGVQGGSIISTLRNANEFNLKPRIAYYQGFVKSFKFNDNFGLEFSLSYLKKGFLNLDPNVRWTYHYLDLQILNKLYLSEKSSGLIGFGFGRLLDISKESSDYRLGANWQRKISLYFLFGTEYQFIEAAALQFKVGYDIINPNPPITFQLGLNLLFWK